MKLKALYFLLMVTVCCSVHIKTYADFGIENNGDGSYTIWMEGGSITTNTQGHYSASQGQGTICNNCYGVPQYASSQNYSPTNSYLPLNGTPPSAYFSTNIVGNYQVYYNSSGQIIDQIPIGVDPNAHTVVIGYTEGCASCAQQKAQQQAAAQWDNTAAEAWYNQQSEAVKQQQIEQMRTEMYYAYNTAQTYNYYYWCYSIQALTNGSTPPLPPPPPPPPPLPPIEKNAPGNTEVTKLLAEVQGVRTYVTPAGTPFTLPAGAQIGALAVDYNDFTNGALYSFYINGVQYAAYESYYQRNTGAPPQFGGYFQVVNGVLDLTKPYKLIPSDYPATVNSTIKVIKVTKVTTPTGCNLVQQVVNYTMGPYTYTAVPATVGSMQAQNTHIENTTPVAGAPTITKPIECTTSPTTSPNSGTELEAYAKNNQLGGPGRVKVFLGVFMKNSVKIYLYDCTTGKAKYTVTKDAVTELTTAQSDAETAKFNNGSFQSADQDFAIKGCLQNGKWQYEVKFNDSKLTPHAKIAPKLAEVKAEIARQAEAEISKLRSVNMRSPGESITVDGEVFAKMSMDIFETLSAVYDVGKDIINEGKMPEKIWDGGKRGDGSTLPAINEAHGKSPFKMPTIISGCTDQLIDEATGSVQLVKTGLEFARNPVQTATTFWTGVKSLDANKIKQMISDASGVTNLTQGGDRARYQGGKYGVQIGAILVGGLKNIVKGAELVEGAGKNMTDVQKFIPDGSTSHPAANALKNATDNKKLVNNVGNEKLLTKNVAADGESVVALEKNGTGTNVFTAKDKDLVDHRSGTTYTYDDIADGAKDVDIAKTSTTVNGIENITTASGKKGSWNKELNNPKENKVYNVQNTNAGRPHKYTTGVGGRVEKVEGDLKLSTRDRNGYQQSVKCNGAKGGTPGTDQGGHLIGSRFDGAGEQINLVPMGSDLNLSQWKNMENNWAQKLEANISVSVKIEVKYEDAAKPFRPTRFIVTETIGGTAQAPKTFLNP